MSTTSTLVKDASYDKHAALEQSEIKIGRATRDTVESIRVIGHELAVIKEGALHECRNDYDFKEYVELYLKFDFRMAQLWMRAARALDQLDAQKLQLPFNQSQVVELAKLKDPETLVGVWSHILDYSEKKGQEVTYEFVRDTVNNYRTGIQQRQTRAPKKKSAPPPAGIEVDLGANGEGAETVVWSEDGEAALNRIRRLCGEAIANAISRGQPKISERDLIAWSHHSNEMVKNLGYWIVLKLYSYRKALAYEESAVDSLTTVGELIERASARGGELYVEFNEARIKVEVVYNEGN